MSGTLDLKGLQETGRQITKALEGGDPSSTLITLLQPLEKWTATEDLLRQSKLGVAVARLRNNKDPKVAQQASHLVNKWKAQVNKKKTGAGSGAPGSPAPAHHKAGVAANGVANGRSGTSSPAPKKDVTSEGLKKFHVAPEKRNAKEDGVDTAVTDNDTRNSCVLLIYNGLAFMSTESPDNVLIVARAVEAAAFQEYKPETSTTYKTKLRSLFSNLKMKQNEALRQDVFSGKISPEKFVKMTSEELKSEDKRREDAALEKENMAKSMTPQEEKAISTTMTCGKCKNSRVAYSQAQTRSADEPMTTFCECQICGNRWKFS